MRKTVFICLATIVAFSAQAFRSGLDSSAKNRLEEKSIIAESVLPTTTDTVVAGAPIPPEIENPELLGINKEPWHATLMVYGNQTEALKAIRHASSYCKSLNGPWKFNWVAWPQERPVDFYKPSFDVSGWKEISVPSNWQVLGYETPYSRNTGYFVQKVYPQERSEPPKTFTP